MAVALAATATTFMGCSAEGLATSDTGWAGQLLESPVERPDFIMADTDGEPFDFRAQTDGLLTLLFIGYTNCPDVCPVHFANLAAVLDRQPYDVKSAVRVVFITADPGHKSHHVVNALSENGVIVREGVAGEFARIADDRGFSKFCLAAKEFALVQQVGADHRIPTVNETTHW